MSGAQFTKVHNPRKITMSTSLGRYLVAKDICPQFESGLRPIGVEGSFSLAAAREELRSFSAALRGTGAEVLEAPVGNFPDDVWVRDPGLAVRNHLSGETFWVPLRPFNASRRPEVDQLTRYVTQTLGMKLLDTIPKDALLEGGDLVPVGTRGMVVNKNGPRRNSRGVDWITALLRNFGYNVIPMTFQGTAYHSDLAVGPIGEDSAGAPVCLANMDSIVDPTALRDAGAHLVALPQEDWYCVNAVRVNGSIILPQKSKRVPRLIDEALPGKKIVVCPMPNLATGDGGSRCACIGLDEHN